MSVVPDTHRLITTLTGAGFSEEQAVVLSDTFNDIDLSTLVTKEDLRNELEKLGMALTIRLGSIVGIGVAILALLKLYG